MLINGSMNSNLFNIIMDFHVRYVNRGKPRQQSLISTIRWGIQRARARTNRVAVIWTLCESRRASVSVCGAIVIEPEDVRPLHCLHNRRFNKCCPHASILSLSLPYGMLMPSYFVLTTQTCFSGIIIP